MTDFGLSGILLVFLATGLVVIGAGMALARYGDEIADRTGIGRVWVGSVLIAAATSLPELTTDVAAVRLGALDLAAGDLFGSSMANMLLLAVVDLVYRRSDVLRRVTLDHALFASLAIAMNALAAVFVLVRPQQVVLGLAPESFVLVLVYLVGTRMVYRHGARVASVAPPRTDDGPRKAGGTVPLALGFAGATVAILVAAPAFAWSGKGLAEMTGLGNTFVGTALLGLFTSLPELASCLAAVRLGAFDLAVGNLFGSNAFNMVIFFAMDLAHPGRGIFESLDPNHALSALFAVVLMALGLAAIVSRAERRFALIEPSSALMVVVYVIGLWVLLTQAI